MSSFLDSVTHSLRVAKILAQSPEVQKWMLIYVFFLASFSSLFAMMGFIATDNFTLAIIFYSIIYIVYFAGIIYFSVRLFSESFHVLGIRTREYGLGILTFISGLAQNLVGFLLLYNQRLFLTFAFIFVLLFGASTYAYFILHNTLLAIIYFFLLALAAIPYFFLYIYHSTRLAFAQMFFLTGKPFSDALTESWDMVRGLTLQTFGAILGGGLVAALIASPFAIIKTIFVTVVQYWALHYSLDLSPNVNLFIATLTFPFDFFMFLVSTAFIFYFIGLFHYTLCETGRLEGLAKRKAVTRRIPRP